MKKSINKEKVKFVKVVNLLGERSDNVLEKTSKALLDGEIWMKDRYPTVTFTENLWFEDPLNDRTWRFNLHSCLMLESLLNLYEKREEERYLEKALFYILSWKKVNFPSSKSDMAWHDHGSALRLIIVSRLYENMKKSRLYNKEIEEEFTELANFHCEKLLDKDFYMEQHNHGMDQDIALYIAGIVFNHLDNAEKWKEISIKRLEIQLASIFAADGSYLEHSPEYSYMLSERLFKFLAFLKEYGTGDSWEFLEEVLKKQMFFLMVMIQPNGFIPALGDSNSSILAYEKWLNPPNEELERIKYVVHGGKVGKRPDFTDHVFPIGGYASLRNEWKYSEKTVQLIFSSSFHSRVHKHHDDLSLTLFAHKMPLLIDSGMYNYNYATDERKYVTSSYAHNSIVVDGKNTEILRLNIGKSGITDYLLEEDFSLVAGSHCLYPGVTQQRIVLYLKPNDILVFDYLRGYTNHYFEQIFNLSPKVKVSKKDDGKLIGLVENKEVISLQPLPLSENLKIDLAIGEKNPLKGWCSEEHSKLIPNTQVSYKKEGRSARFATHVNTEPEVCNITTFSWNEDLIKLKWKSKEFEIILANNHVYVSVEGKLLKTIAIPHPLLSNAISEAKQYEYREKYRDERARRLRYQEAYEKVKGKLANKS